MKGLANQIKSHFGKLKKDNLDIDEEFILVNPNEIYGFISHDKTYIELINSDFHKIKECFPNSIIYLEFVENPECDEGDSLFANVYNPYGNYENDCRRFNSFLLENIDVLLSKDLKFYLNIVSDDEYYRKKALRLK